MPDPQSDKTEQVARVVIRTACRKPRRKSILAPRPIKLRRDPVMEYVQKARQRFSAVAVLRDFIDEIRRHAGVDAVEPEERRADSRWFRSVVIVVLDRVDFPIRESESSARAKAYRLICRRVS